MMGKAVATARVGHYLSVISSLYPSKSANFEKNIMCVSFAFSETSTSAANRTAKYLINRIEQGSDEHTRLETETN